MENIPLTNNAADLVIQAYTIYLVLSLTLTVWVGQTLYKNGTHFLLDAVKGDEILAKSLNHLLIVGFYLINFGFMALNLRINRRLYEVRQVFEVVATQVGLVLLVLGLMHFLNMFIVHGLRQRPATTQPETGR